MRISAVVAVVPWIIQVNVISIVTLNQHISLTDCKVAEALELQRCDKYYYEGKFPKQDVEIIEEKEKIEL